MRLSLAASAAVFALAAAPGVHAGPADPQTLNRIADAGFNHGEVVETIEYLSDQIGGRMTNSPAMRKAEAWTQQKFRDWGLKNVHPEGFEFGRGWWIETAHARMVTPRPFDLHVIPVAWSPGTGGPLTAPVIVAPIRTEADFAKWRGKLKGKIVLISVPTVQKDDLDPPFKRYTDADIARLDDYRQPFNDPELAAQRANRQVLAKKIDDFLAAEGVVARASMSRNDGRIVHGEGGGYKVGETIKVPSFDMAAEDYRRLARLSKVGEVTLELDSKVHFEDADTKAYDIVAEIPGSDPKAGFVMAGAHLDSWVAGDGAADNGAGSAEVMEAARILASLNLHPKRTIRFVLWAGEEQGLLGSTAYVENHFAKRPPPAQGEAAPSFMTNTYPLTILPEYAQMHGYFNIDNGSGKLRGIYAEGNFAATPMLKDWLAPFASLGASAVVAEPTGSTDHVGMVRIGLPAFQFIQDPLDYESRVHHSDLDTFDHLRTEDMRQGAVVLASVLIEAADSDAPLPGNVVPTQSKPTDPFRFPDDNPQAVRR